MQIILSSADIKEAIVASLSGSISLIGKEVSVTFTSGRSKTDLTANVVIAAATSGGGAPAEAMPAFNDEPEELTMTEPLKAEAEGETKTTGSLFKAVPSTTH